MKPAGPRCAGATGLLWAGGLISETGDWSRSSGCRSGSSSSPSSLVTPRPCSWSACCPAWSWARWPGPGRPLGPAPTLVAVSLAEAVFLLPLLAVDGPDRL